MASMSMPSPRPLRRRAPALVPTGVSAETAPLRGARAKLPRGLDEGAGTGWPASNRAYVPAATAARPALSGPVRGHIPRFDSAVDAAAVTERMIEATRVLGLSRVETLLSRATTSAETKRAASAPPPECAHAVARALAGDRARVKAALTPWVAAEAHALYSAGQARLDWLIDGYFERRGPDDLGERAPRVGRLEALRADARALWLAVRAAAQTRGAPLPTAARPRGGNALLARHPVLSAFSPASPHLAILEDLARAKVHVGSAGHRLPRPLDRPLRGLLLDLQRIVYGYREQLLVDADHGWTIPEVVEAARIRTGAPEHSLLAAHARDLARRTLNAADRPRCLAWMALALGVPAEVTAAPTDRAQGDGLDRPWDARRPPPATGIDPHALLLAVETWRPLESGPVAPGPSIDWAAYEDVTRRLPPAGRALAVRAAARGASRSTARAGPPAAGGPARGPGPGGPSVSSARPRRPSRAGPEAAGPRPRHRDTQGWSGAPTPRPPAGQPHLAVIFRGWAQLGEARQAELQGRVARMMAGDPRLTAVRAELSERQRASSVALAKLHGGDPSARSADFDRRFAAADARYRRAGALLARADDLIATRQVQDRARAERLMAEVRAGLMTARPLAEARALAGRMVVGPAARPHAGLVQSAMAEFLRMTRLPVDPGRIKLARVGDARASASPDGVMTLSRPCARQVFHELGHFAEYAHRPLYDAAVSWRRARGQQREGGVRVRSLAAMAPHVEYDPREVAIEDRFYDIYVGALYEHQGLSTTEVMSTGLQHFAHPADMLRLYLADPEHFLFVLGALAS